MIAAPRRRSARFASSRTFRAGRVSRGVRVAHEFRRGTSFALTLSREAAMSMSGLITTKDVLRHSATIVREFGATTYLRCCFAILTGQRTTFLNIVFAR